MAEWFVDWFNSTEYLNVYQHRNNEDAEKLLDLILDNIKISNGAKVLDAACGAGRHSLLFARKGFNVTGFDLSDTLLNIAKKKSIEEKLKIDFIQSDIRNFIVNEKYDLIVNLFTSFGYFDSDKDNFSFFDNAYKMLNKSGYFVFDYFNSVFIKKYLLPYSEKKISDKIITEKRSIKNGRVEKEILIKDNNNEASFLESVKLYDAETLIRLFEKKGFKIINIFGDFEGLKFDVSNSKRLILICQK